jgi:hypothetical protein
MTTPEYLGDDAVGDVCLHAGAHLDGIRDGDRQERRPRRRRRRPRGLRRAPLLRESPYTDSAAITSRVRQRSAARRKRSGGGAGLVVTGEIMASFAVKPPPFPGAARRSDGKKRTSEEKGKRLFFIRWIFRGYFLFRDGC